MNKPVNLFVLFAGGIAQFPPACRGLAPLWWGTGYR